MDDKEWMSLSLADFIETEGNYISSFCGFVLLEKDSEFEAGSVFYGDNYRSFADVAYIPEQIPPEEFFSEDRMRYADMIQRHGGQIMVSVLPTDETALDAGKIYLQIISDLLSKSKALGVYSAGQLYTKEEFLDEMKKPLPIRNWVAFRRKIQGDKCHCFTMGLEAFGVDEFEYRTDCSRNGDEESDLQLLEELAEMVIRDGLHFQSGDVCSVNGNQYGLKRIHSAFFDGHALLLEAVTEA